MTQLTIAESLSQWLALHSLGRKPTSVQFNREIHGIILKHLPNCDRSRDALTTEDVLTFAQAVAHYCPSRWNAIVSALRFVTPQANCLKRRAVRLRDFTPPTHAEFSNLLAECDAAPRSKVGLVIRFLAFTGMRITEARALKWEHVGPDRIDAPKEFAKNGRRRSIPILPGFAEVLARLKAISSTDFVLPEGNVRKSIEKYCRDAGVPPLGHHGFRHLYATRCIESGVDVPTVARWLGHSDGGALLSRTYFHLVDGHSREMAQKVKIAA